MDDVLIYTKHNLYKSVMKSQISKQLIGSKKMLYLSEGGSRQLHHKILDPEVVVGLDKLCGEVTTSKDHSYMAHGP